MGGRVPAGWPLGLETLNLRMSIMDAMRSIDPHPSLLATPSFSSLSSSDFDTESSLSFFPDRSITLGSLIGIHSDRLARHGSSCVHPEDGTQMGRSGIVAGRSKNYWKARRWKSFMGCMYLNSRVDNHPPSLGQFLKAEKKAGASVIGPASDEKVFINIMYEDSDGVLSDANSLFLDPHTSHSSRMGSRRLASLDLAMIQEESPPRLSSTDGLKDWSSTKGGLQVTGRHNRAQSLNSCLPFVSNILGKMSSSRASLGCRKINHL